VANDSGESLRVEYGIDPEDGYVQATLLLGDDAEKWFESDVGKYVLGRAQLDASAALEELVSCSPHDAHAVQELQLRFRTAVGAVKWINDIIRDKWQLVEAIIQQDLARGSPLT
jgi:hypothetical protein